MVIRSNQRVALRKSGEEAFEDEMVEHLSSYASKLYELRGRDVFSLLVHDGIARAHTLGFTFRGPVRMVLECLVTFGARFDSDPLYPGIRAALAKRVKDSHEMDWAETVHERIRSYWTSVIGPQGDIFIAAMGRIREMAHEGVKARGVEPLLEQLRIAYPERFEHATDAGVRLIITKAIQSLQAKSLQPTSESVTLMSSLMFGFGHGVLDDPLYPWVRTALEDTQIAEPEQRILRLRDRAVLYLDHVEKYWSRRNAG